VSLDIARLYDEYGESMYRYLIAKLGSASDAEDVLQEVFCRLVRYSARLRLVRKPRVFVFHIARNEANRFLREKIQNDKTIRSTMPYTDSFRTAFSGPDEPTERVVAAALAQIPDEQREAVILKVLEGLTFREIAAVCGESIPTVASRYRYAIEKIRVLLEGKL
jgi:RNA polymerase sigma-70 factor (ECF subfamily)